MELTLFSFDKQGVLKEVLKHRLDVVDMPFLGLQEDEDVIQVDKDTAVEHILEDVIDQGFEDSWGIGKARWHDQVLIMPGWGVKRCLPVITL